MPRGDKSSYTPKQKRQAHHIEESARERGHSEKKAAEIGWATVNKQDGGAKGGNRSGSSRSSGRSRRAKSSR